jgi:hypothetical protein
VPARALTAELTVLECDRFAIQERKIVVSGTQCDIRNANTGEVVGLARENIGGVAKLLRRVVGKHLFSTTVEVCEKPDDSLVFTLQREWHLFKARVEVRDSLGQLVGYLKSKFFRIRYGFDIHDRDGKVFAQVKGRIFECDYQVLTPDGKVELGRVARNLGGLGGMTREAPFSDVSYYLDVNPDLADQPLAKMLLVAATLAVDVMYKPVSVVNR